MLLPETFLEWVYFDRVRLVKQLLDDGYIGESSLIFRHTPVFSSASIDESGHITVNGKVVGAGFVLKQGFLEGQLDALRAHVESYPTLSMTEYVRNGSLLLLQLLYFENKEEARRNVDFSKISTLELAEGKPGVPHHTWTNLQRYTGEACFTYYMPPTVSFEVKGNVEIHTEGSYHEFVNLVHDCIHRMRPGRTNKPAVILNVQEVYDNSASPKGFGFKLS